MAMTHGTFMMFRYRRPNPDTNIPVSPTSFSEVNTMSRRHSPALAALTEPELRARTRAERQRVRAALMPASMHAMLDEDAPDEPGVEFRAPKRHDPERVRKHGRDHTRHGKQTFWKRRTTVRRAKALASAHLAA